MSALTHGDARVSLRWYPREQFGRFPARRSSGRRPRPDRGHRGRTVRVPLRIQSWRWPRR